MKEADLLVGIVIFVVVEREKCFRLICLNYDKEISVIKNFVVYQHLCNS